MKTVLVTGGCGFIGSHVVDQLRNHDYRIRVLDRHTERFREPFADVEYYAGNFSDTDLLSKALHDVDSVIHLASSAVPQTSNRNPAKDIHENLLGSISLLDALVRHDVRKIIFLSSGGTIYGIPTELCIDEEHPLEPIVSYGIVKLANEKYIRLYSRMHGLDYCILRASNPYGPRQGRLGIQGVIGTFLNNLSKGDPLEIWGDGSVTRDFLYVSDLAKLCALSIDLGSKSIYNASSSIGYSISDIINVLSRVTGIKITAHYRESMPYDVPYVVLNNQKARREFNWQPEINLEEGIRATWQWMQSMTLP